ncbi:MAG: internal scaffolding protein [Microviridae sp.]|nr:MAG: internal scaffolding protein [Microviridae sp.]
MAAKRFATQYDDLPRVYEPAGSRDKQLYSPMYDSRGVLYLEPSGKHDLYAEIQSHRDSVDIHVLLARYRNGDEAALQRIQGAYGDFTHMPKTFAEALNVMTAAQQYFLGLPVETRAKFGHDFNRFIAAMDGPTWYSDVGFAPPVPDDNMPEASQKPDGIKTAPETPGTSSPAPAPDSVETQPS